MATLISLLPFAIGIAVLALMTLWLLRRHAGFGPWLLALLMVAHGWVHAMFVFPSPEQTAGEPEWPFDMTRSWLVTSGRLDVSAIRAVGIALVIVVVIGFVLAALSTVGLLVPAGWWGALVTAAAAASMVMLAIFFSPQLILGFAIDIGLLWLVFGSGWNPEIQAGGASLSGLH